MKHHTDGDFSPVNFARASVGQPKSIMNGGPGPRWKLSLLVHPLHSGLT